MMTGMKYKNHLIIFNKIFKIKNNKIKIAFKKYIK